MALLKNLALMSVSTGSRLVAGLVTFALLARLLGPASFGIFMLWLSVGGLLAMLSNFGLTPYLLREIGAHPENTTSVISELLTGKLLLTAGLLLLAALGCFFIAPGVRLVFLFLLGGLICETFTEFLNAGFRAGDRYAAETRMATLSALIYCGLMGGVVWVWPNALAASVAFFASRLIVAALTLGYLGNYIGQLKPASAAKGLARLRSVVVYAIDYGFQGLFGQIDSVVLNHFIGPAAVGIYQAGMKLFFGAAQASQVLANVFLPRAAARSKLAEGFAGEAFKIQAAFLTVGGVFGLALALLASPLVNVLYGRAYAELIGLMPWFGLLFFVRHAAAAWGVLLTAAGAQKFRTQANAAHWGVIAISTMVLVPHFGSRGWIASLVVGNAILSFVYAWRAAHLVTAAWRTLGMTFVLGLAFVPFVLTR